MAELSVISTTTVIRGNVRGQGSLRVDGRVQGDIEVTGDVVLGPDAEVQGNITGASIAVAGNVSGDLTGSEAVLIEAGAKVVGDLRAPRIGIGDGAQVRGSVETSESQGGNTSGLLSATARSVAARPVARANTGLNRPLAAPARGNLTRPAAPAAVAAAPAPMARAKDEEPEPEKAVRRGPPPPVVSAPKIGSKGRKKRAKGE
jgi:cytoskeletal protein CcmA (bactofilin family)